MAKKYDNPKIQAYADKLHREFCSFNHTDGCGYLYTSWSHRPLRDELKSWYRKAERILREQAGL